MINILVRKVWGILILMLTALSVIVYQGCKDSSTNPPEEKPPEYQEDIVWPSLADSPWPMYNADPQGTNRSKSTSSISGNISQTTKKYNIESSISLGPDGSMFFTTTSDQKLYCLDSSGNEKWSSALISNRDGGFFAPVILNDGSVLAADAINLYKFNKDGQQQWKYSYSFNAIPTINIGKDGTIYVIGDFHSFLAISSDGQLLWQLNDAAEVWMGTTAISADGQTIYFSGNALSAVDLSSHTIKWKTNFTAYRPVADSHGKIFCFRKLTDSTALLCLNSAGEIVWTYNFKDEATSITIDKNGNLLFGDDNIYSVNYNGQLNWKMSHVNDAPLPVICDNKNNIYMVRATGTGFIVRCISESGSILFESTQSVTNYTPSFGGALGFNKLFIVSWNLSPVFTIR